MRRLLLLIALILLSPGATATADLTQPPSRALPASAPLRDPGRPARQAEIQRPAALPAILEISGPAGGPRARTTCKSMPQPAPAAGLIGRNFGNGALWLPTGLRLTAEVAMGSSQRMGAWSAVTATRGNSMVLLLARMTVLHTPRHTITDALELGIPCAGLVIEARSCDVDGRPDPRVLALMDESYVCGGHGVSSPVRAWRIRRDRLQEIDSHRVTCGSVSCEVDRDVDFQGQ